MVMIRGLKFTTKGGPGSGHHGHAGIPGQVGGSVAGGAGGFTQSVLNKATPYLQPNDISRIRTLSEDKFLSVEGVTNKDAAFYNAKTREIVLNELQMALRDSQTKKLIIGHEIGHAVGDRLALKHEETMIKIWEPYAQSLSGNARYSVSEGFAEMFAMNLFDKGRLKRIMGPMGIQKFNDLLRYAKED